MLSHSFTRVNEGWAGRKEIVGVATRGSEFGEDQADAAYEVVRWGLVSGQGKKLDGEVAGVGSEDEAALVEVDEAEEEGGAAADAVERGLMGAVGGEGVVVAVEDGDGAGRD